MIEAWAIYIIGPTFAGPAVLVLFLGAVGSAFAWFMNWCCTTPSVEDSRR